MATTTMTKEYFEDLGRIAETNAKSAQQSARIATEYWVASRERNNEVAQQIARTLTEGMRRQTDANEEITTKIFEILEERDEAHKRFFEQWAQAYASVPFDLLSRPLARRRRRPHQSRLLAVRPKQYSEGLDPKIQPFLLPLFTRLRGRGILRSSLYGVLRSSAQRQTECRSVRRVMSSSCSQPSPTKV